ncbi:MAG: DUF4785 family protein [Kangiellaceae bacterium]|nr:DUF4785 family protein [Kangiellaceae bacterium]
MRKLTITASLALALASTTAIAQNSVQNVKANTGYVYSEQDFERGVANLPMNTNAFNSVSYSFAITDPRMLDMSQKQSHTQSREFSMDVTGAQLQKGINLSTSGKGALVRISAFDGKSAIEPRSLDIISHKAGKQTTFAKGSGFDTIVDSQAMQKTGMGFQRGTTGFKMADNLGQGQFTLKAGKDVNANSRYRINVFDKNSDTELHLTANKNAYLQSDKLHVSAKVFDQGDTQKIRHINGQIVSPDGSTHNVIFSKSADGYQVNMPLNMPASKKPGVLWELETEVETMVDGQMVKRNGRVPFAYTYQTAKFAGSAQLMGAADNLTAMVPVQAVSDGRYEVRGVLYATNHKGQRVPVMVTHSAANLSAGNGAIVMQFDTALLAKSGLKAPFSLDQVQLRDQTQMAVLAQ